MALVVKLNCQRGPIESITDGTHCLGVAHHAAFCQRCRHGQHCIVQLPGLACIIWYCDVKYFS